MTNQAPVPLLDLRIQNDEVAAEVRRAIDEVCASGAFVLGPQVTDSNVSSQPSAGSSTSSVSATAPTPSCSPCAVPASARATRSSCRPTPSSPRPRPWPWSGADLALVDCTEDFLLDAEALAAKVTERTRAVIGVDLYGQVAPFEAHPCCGRRRRA